MTWHRGRIDPPWFWKPWINPWTAWLDWYSRPRPVTPPRER